MMHLLQLSMRCVTDDSIIKSKERKRPPALMKAVAFMQRMFCHTWLATIYVLFCIGWLLNGCSQATGNFFSPAKYLPPDQTMVYLYFPKQFPKPLGSSLYSSTNILASGKTVTRLDEGGYYPLRVAPGRVAFAIAGESENHNLTMTAEPGRTYFVKVLIHNNSYYQLFLVNEELAHGEMGPLRLMATCDNAQGCTQNLP